MRVLIDDEAFIVQRFGGISRIFSELIKRLKQQSEVKLFFYNFYSENEYLLPLKITTLKPYLRQYRFPLKAKTQRTLSRWISHPHTINIIKNKKIDLFHPSYYTDYYLPILQKNKNIKLVFTVHDLIHEMMQNVKGYKELSEKKRENILRADHIITVSQSTKNDLLKFYPTVDEKKITVVHLAQSLNSESVSVKNLPEKYVLFVGERRGYKNFNFFLTAYANFAKQHPEIHLVCTGSNPFSKSEKQQIKELGIKQNIVHVKCSDAELKYIYEHAFMFVFPSLYEGFGIPILEAFSCSVPVILSNTSSLPEVAQEAALYFEPTSQNDLLQKMLIATSDDNLRKELIEKGKLRLRDFSWDKHYQLTLSIYQSLNKR